MTYSTNQCAITVFCIAHCYK